MLPVKQASFVAMHSNCKNVSSVLSNMEVHPGFNFKYIVGYFNKGGNGNKIAQNWTSIWWRVTTTPKGQRRCHSLPLAPAVKLPLSSP